MVLFIWHTSLYYFNIAQNYDLISNNSLASSGLCPQHKHICGPFISKISSKPPNTPHRPLN